MRRYLTELARHRDLLFWLAAKEIKVRYKLPLLGFLWALLVPLSLSLILWLIFTYVMPIPMRRYPFFLFLITGMFPWNFFAQSVSNSTMSVLEAGQLVRKSAFPRVLIPVSIVAANLFNFLMALAVVIAIIVVWGVPISRWVWLLPVAVGLHVVLTTGITLLVASLQVRYRDVKYLAEVGLLLWFYLTPIFYPLDLIAHIPSALQAVYLLNPFVAIVELYRLALLGGTLGAAVMPSSAMLSLGIVLSLGLFLIGFASFRRHEQTFADWVTG
jgi:ABC-type polysaccharide/polyol phosphate export permease